MPTSEEKAEKVRRVLDALVEEAYQREIARGTAISKPENWRAWKRERYVDQARREGPGWLRSQYTRLVGAEPRRPARRCAHCDAIITTAWLEVDDQPYCDEHCRDGAPLMSFREYVESQRAKGREITGPIRRVADQLNLDTILEDSEPIR
jgi:hypothetical protein